MTTNLPEPPAPGSRAERALWSFLLITLVAPFFASLIVFLSAVIAGAIHRGPASLIALDTAGQFAWAADKAVTAYVWSAIPAAVCAAIVAALVWTYRPLHWLLAASLGAITATVLAALSGGMIAQHAAPIAFIAALSGIATQAVLKRARLVN